MSVKTLLQIITSACERAKINAPLTVYGSTDTQIVQMRALLEEGLEHLVYRNNWNELRAESVWTTTATEDQGSLDTLAPGGLRKFLPETFWDRTELLPNLGPIDGADWQFLKAIPITGPRYMFRVMNNHFYSTPAPPAGHTWAFEYLTDKCIYNPLTLQYLDRFDADTNQIRLPSAMVLADLRWRWKKEKGLDYAQDFDDAEAMITNVASQDGGNKTLSMDDCDSGIPLPQIGMKMFNTVP